MQHSRRHSPLKAGLFLLAFFTSAAAAAQPSPPSVMVGGGSSSPIRMGKISGSLPLYFMQRPATDGSRMRLSGAAEAPVLITLASPPTPDDLALLLGAGAHVELRRDGSPSGVGSTVVARLPAARVGDVAALPRVTKIALDGSPFMPPPPLDSTAAEVQAPSAWRSWDATGETKLTGAGITLCDIDSGVDPLHPLFFRADGGYFNWNDENADGVLTPGVDTIDLDGDGAPTVLRVLNSPVAAYWSDKPIFGSADPAFKVGLDWLYVDEDGSGEREYGPDAGFTEFHPTYGERLLVADDVNRNGQVDAGEKLVALLTPKIAAYRVDKKVYRRGKNLINAPRTEDSNHGTGAAGVMIGGALGLTKLVGIAPDAELVVASNRDGTSPVALANFCIDEGARVVLHEYAPWVGYHLDGSSPMEELIDETTLDGVAHINPAGNLSTSKKLFKRTIPSGEETAIAIEAPVNGPYGDFEYLGLSVLWRDPARNLALTLEDPTGFSKSLSAPTNQVLFEAWHDGLSVYALREDSGRGTARVDIYLFSQGNTPVPIGNGTWTLRVGEPSAKDAPPVEVIAYVLDERSGWGKGVHFPEHSSEDHLIGFPGTADFGVAVAAYTGHGFFGGVPGERASYSGRGRRIDGKSILWISAPDDPISGGFFDGTQAPYIVYGGTSGASPHVAGAAALLIQADPKRTGRDVRDALKAGAYVDEAVGDAPNEDYGYGKLRIYQSLFGKDAPGGSAPIVKAPRASAKAGTEAAVALQVFDADEASEALVLEVDRDYDGAFEERLMEPVVRGAFEAPGTYFAKVRATDSTGRSSQALAVIDVLAAEAGPDAADSSLVADGGCAHREERGGSLWPLFGAALAGLSARLRRSRRS